MRAFALAVSACLAIPLAACAGPNELERPAQVGEQSLRVGVVSHIEGVEVEGDHALGVGTVIGAAAGGVIGHQVGGGRGQDVATVLGVIGGGLAGHSIENRNDRRMGQRITVRLDDGDSIIVTQPSDAGLRSGDRVQIEGEGRAARVLRR